MFEDVEFVEARLVYYYLDLEKELDKQRFEGLQRHMKAVGFTVFDFKRKRKVYIKKGEEKCI